MQLAHTTRDPRFGYSLTLSIVLHAALLTVLVWWQQLIPDLGPVQTTYYVDVVNLPVAAPRSGSPVQTADSADVAPPPPAAEPPAMTAPQPKGASPAKQTAPKSDASSFQERMAKIASAADSKRQAQRIEELRSKVAATGRSGMPRGTGSEAGSDYTAYVHSRLKDAFKETISYQTKSPFVAIRLSIDGDGKIIRTRLEKSSNDKVFELSVRRAIALAEKSLVPPPGRVLYEGVFLFRPQGVMQQ